MKKNVLLFSLVFHSMTFSNFTHASEDYDPLYDQQYDVCTIVPEICEEDHSATKKDTEDLSEKELYNICVKVPELCPELYADEEQPNDETWWEALKKRILSLF